MGDRLQLAALYVLFLICITTFTSLQLEVPLSHDLYEVISRRLVKPPWDPDGKQCNSCGRKVVGGASQGIMPLHLPLVTARVSVICALICAHRNGRHTPCPYNCEGTWRGSNQRCSCREQGQKERHDLLSCAPPQLFCHNYCTA